MGSADIRRVSVLCRVRLAWRNTRRMPGESPSKIGAVCQLARHSPMRFKPGKASQDQRDRRKPALPAPSPTPVTTIHDVVSGPISPASAVIEPYLIDRQGALFVLAIERLKSRMCRPSETRRRGRKHDSRRRDGRNENGPHSAKRPYSQR
jgi:hypothetical protein